MAHLGSDTMMYLKEINLFWASLVAQRLKPLPAMQETWV